jgi:mono/diheme cytochrome c family protein
VFDGKLVMGLGNSTADFSNVTRQNFRLMAAMAWRKTEPAKFSAAGPLVRTLLKVNEEIETEVRGVNPADRLAMVLAAHRDPKTLEWNDSAMLDIPHKIIPTDVPAWWLLKKKHAMFYTGFGRGDFSRFLMMSNLMTVRDSTEAREVSSHFGDVLAFINKIEPPKYPRTIDGAKAKAGEAIYTRECSKCHGTYGKGGQYPNLLVPGGVVGTDSALYLANQQSQPFIEWFNNSWFSEGDNRAHLVPGNGYVAPPLDGIWITAPYLHNGSVPDLESLLNSKNRPQYWMRDFVFPQYDYEKVGWRYTKCDKADGKKVYNTTLVGYNNYGHTFGDKLTDQERASLIEYLKTL